MKALGRKAAGLLLWYAVACVAIARAQAPETGGQAWDLSLWAAGATGEESTNSFAESRILSAGVFVGRAITGDIGKGWYRGRFEYGFDIAPVFMQFQPQRITGVAFDPVIFRWQPRHRILRSTPFLELGGGGVHTTVNLPAGDTSNFNFTARGGGGLMIATRRRQALEVGCRWWHISNANLGTRNPEFNGIQVSVGYHWLR